MPLFPQVVESKTLSPVGGSWALNKAGSFLTIPKQNRRLETIVMQVNFTTSVATSGTLARTTGNDGIDSIFSEVRVRVSDVAGTNRHAIKCPSSTLLAYHRLVSGAFGRNTMEALTTYSNAWSPGTTASTAASAKDLFIPIHLRHPLVNEPIGNRLGIPLDSRFISDDVFLEVDTAASDAVLGFSGSPVPGTSINYVRVHLFYREVPNNIAYVPSALETSVQTYSTTGAQITAIPRTGWLGALMLEPYTAATVRGNILTSQQNDYYTLRYGRSIRYQWNDLLGTEIADFWGTTQSQTQVVASGIQGHCQPPAAHIIDLLHDRTHDDAISPATLWNLYTDNTGDAAYLEASSVTATKYLKTTTQKFLVPDIAALVGA